MQSGRRRARHVVERGADDVGRARQPRRSEGVRLGAHASELVVGDAAKHGGCPGTDCGDHDEVTQAFEQVVDETTGVLAGLHHTVDGGERRGRVGGGERVDDLVEQRRVRVAEESDRALVGDGHRLGARGRIGPGDQLVEQRERVSRRAAACPNHQGQHAALSDHALFTAQLLDVLEHRGRRHQTERIVVRARADGAENLLGLGRREDELDVLRRLFDELQESVEPLRRHHVRLVEDEDLVTVAAGSERRPLAQVAGIVDAVVAGRIDLYDVE